MCVREWGWRFLIKINRQDKNKRILAKTDGRITIWTCGNKILFHILRENIWMEGKTTWHTIWKAHIQLEMPEFPSAQCTFILCHFSCQLQLHIEFWISNAAFVHLWIFRLLIVLLPLFSVKGKLKIGNFAYASWLATSIVFKYCRHKLSFCEPKCMRRPRRPNFLPSTFWVGCSGLVTNNLNMSYTPTTPLSAIFHLLFQRVKVLGFSCFSPRVFPFRFHFSPVEFSDSDSSAWRAGTAGKMGMAKMVKGGSVKSWPRWSQPQQLKLMRPDN